MLVVETPSGGQHLYYNGSLPGTAAKLGPGIDTRGRASYVLAPPSIVDGRQYTYGERKEAAVLPDAIASKVNTQAEARTAPSDVELDMPYSLEVAQRWLDQQPQAIEGSASDTFYRYACRLKDLGISAKTSIEMMHAHSPHYEDWDIANRVNNAWKTGQNAPGSDRPRSPEEVFEGVAVPPLYDSGFRSRAWLAAQSFAPLEWHWQFMMPSCEPMIITGPPKVGKTTFLLNLAVHQAAGKEFLGLAMRPAPVVMVFAQDRYAQIWENLKQICEQNHIDQSTLDNIFIRSVLSEPVDGGHWLATADDYGNVASSRWFNEYVAPTLARLDRPVFMVDLVLKFIKGFNRFSEQTPNGVVDWLTNVARIGNGVTPVLTDHPTIASVEQGRDIGGSVQMEGSFPTVCALKAGRWEQGPTLQRPMTFETKYSRYSRERTLNFYRFEGSYAFSMIPGKGMAADDRKLEVYRYILEGLYMEPKRLVMREKRKTEYKPVSTPADIAKALSMDTKLVRELLEVMENDDWIVYRERDRTELLPAHFEKKDGLPLSELKPRPGTHYDEPAEW